MDRPELHRRLAWAIAAVLGVGLVVALFAPPGEVPAPPRRVFTTPEVEARCAELEEIVEAGVQTSDIAGVDEAPPPFEVEGDVGRRIVPPSGEPSNGLNVFDPYREDLGAADDSQLVVVDAVRYEEGNLAALRRVFADQAEAAGWTRDEGVSDAFEQGTVLMDFADVYLRPDGDIVARTGNACTGRGWFGATRTLVPSSRIGACAPGAVRERCRRLAETSRDLPTPMFAERSGGTYAAGDAGAISLTFHVVDDSSLGRGVTDLAEGLLEEGWAWTDRPPRCPSPFSDLEVDVDIPTPQEVPLSTDLIPPGLGFDDDALGLAASVTAQAQAEACVDDLFFWDIPLDRPTTITFTRSVGGGAQTVRAVFTPVLGSDEVDGVDSNDIEAGYDAEVTLTEADALAG